jgi:hypothetical protein
VHGVWDRKRSTDEDDSYGEASGSSQKDGERGDARGRAAGDLCRY